MELLFFIVAVLVFAALWKFKKVIDAKIEQNKYDEIVRKEKARQDKLNKDRIEWNKQVFANHPRSTSQCNNFISYGNAGGGTEIDSISDLIEPTGDWDIDKGWPHQGISEDRSSSVEWDSHDTRSSWSDSSSSSDSYSSDSSDSSSSSNND